MLLRCLVSCLAVVIATQACESRNWIVVVDSLDLVAPGLPTWAAGWCCVAVLMKPLPSPPANVVVLNPADMPSSIKASAVRDGTTTANRRNAGVLFAMYNKAENIFELNADVELTGPLSDLQSTSFFFTNATFNPYAYFGQPSVWPRGWPLSRVGKQSVATSLPASHVHLRRDPLIHHTVTNGAPELGETFILTRVVHGATATIEFGPRVPLCAVGAGYLPLHGQATLYTRDALWAMVLSDDDTDLIRGYWAQRVVRELGGAVAIHGPITRRNTTAVLHTRSEADVLLLASREIRHQATLAELAAFLDAWTRPADATTACTVAAALATDMAKQHFWTNGAAGRVREFLQALQDVGYVCPPCAAPERPAPTGAIEDTRFTVQPQGVVRALPGVAAPVPWDVTQLQSRVATLWRSSLQMSADSTRITDIPARTLAVTPAPSYVPCAALLDNPAAKTVPRILFVVNYHFGVHANSNSTRFLLENVYAHYFNTPFDVVFTSPGGGVPGVIGNGLPEAGFYSYHSLTAAYVRYPGYDGYFLVNDDLVLVQTMFEASLFAWRWQYPWTVGMSSPICRPGGHWPWEAYCPSTIEVFRSLCGNSYRGDACADDAVYSSQADAFYVPGRLMAEWVRWSNAFVSKAVFLELAVPTIIRGISDVHCDTGADVLARDMYVEVCTTFTDARSKLYEGLVSGLNDQHCAAYHPVKFSTAEVRDTVKTYFERLSATRCLKPANECTLTYRQDADGFLWRRS